MINLDIIEDEPLQASLMDDEMLASSLSTEIIKGLNGYTPQKGIDYFDGEDGKTPIKGIDYFDGNDGYTPRKGIDYFDGQDGVSVTHSWNGTKLILTSASGTTETDLIGKKGDDGYTPIKGVDYFDGADGYTPQKNVDYFDGKDGYTPQKNIDYFDGEKGDKGERGSDAPAKVFTISYEHFTVVNNATKGVAPYSTSYGSADITIDEEWAEETGFDWVEGALYNFIIDETIGSSTYRNGRIRIGENGDWKPIFGYNSAYEAVYSYLVKAQTYLYQYKSNVIADGCLCREYDANTTYAYLVNTIPTGNITIDANGYGARYSLVFPTTSLSELNEEKWSSIVASSATGTTKKKVNAQKLYIDRLPLYIYSANITAGSVSANALYEHYTTHDIRYLVNTSATYCSINKRLFLYLHNFNPEDLSFEPDATIGNVLTPDKFATRFPKTVEGDVYLYFLGWNSSTWYTCSPNFTQANKLFKYTPSTGEFHDTNIVVG